MKLQQVLVILSTVLAGILALFIVKWVFAFFIEHWISSVLLLLCAVVGGFIWLAKNE